MSGLANSSYENAQAAAKLQILLHAVSSFDHSGWVGISLEQPGKYVLK